MAALWWHMSRFTNVCVSNETYICHRWCCDRRMFANTNMGVHLHLRAQYDVWNIGRLAARMSAKGREDPHKGTFGSGSRRCQGVLCMCVVVVLVSSTHQTRPDPCCSVGGMLFAYWVFVVLVCCCCLVSVVLSWFVLPCLIKNCFVLCCVVLCCVVLCRCLVLSCLVLSWRCWHPNCRVISCLVLRQTQRQKERHRQIPRDREW
jgi:hypothetical protein